MNGPELLNLVRQYGTKRYMHGRSSLGRLSDSQEYEEAADALLARIAALVAQPTPFVPEFPSRNPSTGEPWTREQFEALSACWPLPSGEIPGPAQA